MSEYRLFLHRRVERALESYLKTQVKDGSMRIYRSADMAAREYPCAVCRVFSSHRFRGELYAAQRILAAVRIMVEYADGISDAANVIKEFEDTEELAVSYVQNALMTTDLAAQLNAIGIPGITFSLAHIGDDSSMPTLAESEEVENVSVVQIPLVLIAGPVEITS
ncbi:MAG: hypothetical protein ABIH03_07620 [Pseudomonadota bacterium]